MFNKITSHCNIKNYKCNVWRKKIVEVLKKKITSNSNFKFQLNSHTLSWIIISFTQVFFSDAFELDDK